MRLGSNWLPTTDKCRQTAVWGQTRPCASKQHAPTKPPSLLTTASPAAVDPSDPSLGLHPSVTAWPGGLASAPGVRLRPSTRPTRVDARSKPSSAELVEGLARAMQRGGQIT